MLRQLLQQFQNASILEQGCAGLSSGSANRKHQITCHPWRTSLQIRPSLSFTAALDFVSQDLTNFREQTGQIASRRSRPRHPRQGYPERLQDLPCRFSNTAAMSWPCYTPHIWNMARPLGVVVSRCPGHLLTELSESRKESTKADYPSNSSRYSFPFLLTLAASARWHRPASCAGVFRSPQRSHWRWRERRQRSRSRPFRPAAPSF